MKDRRKIVYVTHAQLLRVLMGHRVFQNHIVIPQLELPNDVIVLGMIINQDRNAHGLIICSGSFPEVKPGTEWPYLEELEAKWITVDVQRPEGKEKP